MIINPEFRKCVTYLFVDKLDKSGETIRSPLATAFYVGFQISSGWVMYLVTARHVIRKSRPFGPLIVRNNLSDGTFQDSSTSQNDWIEHPETDVAVTPARFPNKFDGRYIPSGLLATKDFISKNQIAEGDDVFFCGMFQGYPGQQRMQPVIRFGNISLMPHEKVTLRDSKEDSPYSTEAYLVESRSWGGHSGSPTWLYLNPNRFPGQIVFQQGTPNFVLLGLVAAHFELPQNVDFVGDILEGGTVNINAGLAIVIPAHFILDLLMRDELVEHRQQIEKTGGK